MLATGGAQRTIGVMSTPATGGMTLRVALSSGSVGMATMLHGRVLRSYLGNQERTTRMRKAMVKSVSVGPRKNLIGATHDTSPAAAGSTTDTRATTPASAAAVCGCEARGGRQRQLRDGAEDRRLYPAVARTEDTACED